jgi:hypothetical protein
MSVEKDGYKLYQVPINLKGGDTGIRYFFAKNSPKVGELVDELPAGFKIKDMGQLAPVLKKV